ncbi:hypothetical protein [Aureicoccus marinus]|jgi:hypothetical protein|uniref:Uncharacterized protein n=1 Tax=Aureicoccus marinus TaxID=754435 RepID=A0A2S7T8B7_9FLAO|nr:hypothetical protein [Aureicoccus marinus]PQJ16169.1 hypothetical protein BST99_10920 [Aureicoccus marinus]
MKTLVHLQKGLVLLALALVFSCNTISSEDFVMTNNNTDRFSLQHRFWVGVDDQGIPTDTIGIEARGYSQSAKRKIWILEPNPNPDGSTPIYIRYQGSEPNRGVYQITSYDEEGRSIQFLTGFYRPDRSELVLYEPSDDAMASLTEKLKKTDLQYELKKDKIHFKAETAQKHADVILEMLKDFKNPEDFNDSLILRGVDDKAALEALLATAKKN